MLNNLKYLVYEVVLFISKIRRNRQSLDKNTILLVKTDELGDYILFRNYIQLFCDTFAFDKKIILIGNDLWREFFIEFDDRPKIITTYWINKKRFKREMLYRYKFLQGINRLNVEIAINFVYSRSRRIDDAILSASSATTKIGYLGDGENVVHFEKYFGNKLYDILIDVPYQLHDFLKHHKFLENLMRKSLPIPILSIQNRVTPSNILINTRYAVIFPGSGNPSRIWKTDHFCKVADFLSKEYTLDICLCGSKSDEIYANNIINTLKYPVIDLCGKANFSQLISILQNATCIVSIDTGAIHLAAACNVTCFGIFNGERYGRFAPYPKIMNKNMYSIYPSNVDIQLQNNNSIVSYGSYNEVNSEKVIKVITRHFNAPQ